MSHLTLAFLGPPHVELDGVPVKTDRRKAIALLAVLATTGRAHSRESLATLLWTEFDAASALAYLRRTLWELGQLIGKERIDANRETLAFRSDAGVWLDVAEFRQRLGGPAAELVSAARLAVITDAVRLYRGDFLEGLKLFDAPAFESWLLQESEALRREYRQAMAALAAGQEQHGLWGAGVSTVQRWLAEDAYDEAAHRQMMRLQIGLGDRTAAIRQFEACERLLSAELGIAPSAETIDLANRIRRGERVPPGQPPATGLRQFQLPESEQPAAPRHNLPAPPTPFVGREAELREIGRLLARPESRLVTLLGPGGSGKTRLAIQAGLAAASEPFNTGVCFVALAPLQDAAELDQAVADALRLSIDTEEETRQQLLNALRGKKLLLILDNIEQLLPEGASLPAAIAAAAPDVRLIVTSRTRLNVMGEQLFAVGGMALPAAAAAADASQYDAVRLFLQSARRLRPTFGQEPQQVAAVERICRLVFGLPLAIELAAGWVELLSAAEIAAEIERSLDFLEAAWQDAPKRHRTLRAVFNSSWQLLGDEERETLAALTVFRGSFSRSAAAAVAGAQPRLLLALLHKSWLQRNDADRYELHDLLRQYAVEMLAATPQTGDAIHRRHAFYYADFLKGQHQAIHTDQKLTLDVVMAEFAQIRAAWSWLAAKGEWRRLIDDILPVLFVLHATGRATRVITIMLNQLDELLTANNPGHPDQVAAHAACQYCRWDLSDKQAPGVWLDNLQQLEEWPQHALWYLLLVVVEAHQANQYADGLPYLEHLAARFRQPGDPFLAALALGWQGDFRRHLGQLTEARAALEASIVLYGQMWPHFGHADAARWLAEVVRREGDTAASLAYLDESVRVCEQLDIVLPWSVMNELAAQAFAAGDVAGGTAVFRREQARAARHGNLSGLASSLGWESIHLARYGVFDQALAARQQALALEESMAADETLMGWNRLEMGEVYRLAGDLQSAQSWYEAALIQFDKAHAVDGSAQVRRALADLALARAQYQRALEGFAACLAYFEGRDWWQTAYAAGGLGRAYLGLGKPAAARQQFLVALRNQQADDPCLKLANVVGLAEAFEKEGNLAAAVRLARIACDNPATWYEPRMRAAALGARHGLQLTAAALAQADDAASRPTLGDVLAEWLSENQVGEDDNRHDDGRKSTE